MFEVLNIPLPVVPGGALGMLIGLSAVLVGLTLALLGRTVVWRITAAGFLAAVGAVVADRVAPSIESLGPWLTAIVAACCGVIGLVLARVVWGAGAGAAAAAGTELALLHRIVPAEATDIPAGFAAEGLTIAQWAHQAVDTLVAWLDWMVGAAPVATLLAGAAAAMAGIVLGMARPVAARIVGTSIVGAALIVGGACTTLTSLISDVDLLSGRRPWVLLGSGVVITVAGMAYQIRLGRSKPDNQKTNKDDNDDKDDNDT